ncbi:MAG: hypothetical protein PF904_12150 [Kiritimatiellae bacterium]|nr:hypothetical protein [Kiritimatiellia bacterium]
MITQPEKLFWTIITCGTLSFALTAGTAPVNLEIPSVAIGDKVDAVVTNAESAASDIVIGGTVRKLGIGNLTVTNSLFTGGCIKVAQGSLTLVPDSSLAAFPLPESLTGSDLLLWTDATTNVVTDNGSPLRVQKWCDVRETNTNAPTLLFAGQHDPEPGPLLSSDPLLGAEAYLNFGMMQSNGCWLSIMEPGEAGAITSNKTVTASTVFAIRGTYGDNGYYGFFFGSWSGTGNVGDKNFHTGNSNGSPAPIWNEETSAGVRNGITSVDGRKVPAYSDRPNGDYQLFSTLMPTGDGKLSNFFNDRNYRPPVTHFRQGGGQLSEVLLFNSALSENDRLTVEGYLQSKWFNRSQDGSVHLMDDTSATLTAETGETLTMSGVSGDGTLFKNGAGTLHLRKNAALAPRTILLLDGTLTLGPLVTRTDMMVEVSTNAAIDFATSGKQINVTEGTYTCTTLAQAGILSKIGSGTWTVAEIPASVTTVKVEAGSLRIAPRAATGDDTFVAGTVTNPSFELPGTLSTWAYNPGGGIPGWTFMPATKIDEGGSQVDKGSGLTKKVDDGTPWLGASIATLDGGSYAAYIQRSGTLEGTITLQEDGTYQLTFAHAKRTSNPDPVLELWFDGTYISTVIASSDNFVRQKINLPYRTAGSYTLLFQGVQREIGDRASLIDDIRVERIENSDAIIPDGSFEAARTLALKYSNQAGYDVGSTLNGNGWTFTDAITNQLPNTGSLYGLNIKASGIAEDVGNWVVTPTAGGRTAFIMGDGELSVTLTFPTSGVYRLSFLGAGATGDSPYSHSHIGYNMAGNLPCVVKLDTTTIKQFTLGIPTFMQYDMTLPPVTNGQSCILTFAGNTGTNALSRIGLIDNVQVTRIGPAVAVNTGFETPAISSYYAAPSGGIWEFMSDTESGDPDTKAGLTTALQPFTFSIPEGRQAAFLQKTAYIRQSVSFPEDGVYTISFMAAARSDGRYSHSEHDFAVQLDGETAGTVTTTSYLYDRYTFRLPCVQAGVSYVLAFQGINTAGGDRSSSIDDVRIKKLDVEDEAYAPFPSGLAIEMEEDTGLILDFAGTQALHSLRVGSHLLSGEISSTTEPDIVTGMGTLIVPNSGTLIMLH